MQHEVIIISAVVDSNHIRQWERVWNEEFVSVVIRLRLDILILRIDLVAMRYVDLKKYQLIN